MNTPFVTGPYQAEPPPNTKLNGVELTVYGKACVESFIRGLSPKSLKILCKESKHQPLDPESFRQSLLQDFRGGRELPRPVLDRLKVRLSLDGLLKSFGESFHRNTIPAWIRLFGFGHTEIAIVLDGRSETSSLLTIMQRLRPDQVPNVSSALDILSDSICGALLPLRVKYALEFLGYTGKFNPQLDVDPVEEITGEPETQPSAPAQDSSAKAYLKAYDQGRADSAEELTRLQSEKSVWESRLTELKTNHEDALTTLNLRHQEQLQNLTQALKEAEASRLTAEQATEQLKRQLFDVESSIDSAVARRLERELSSTVRPWLEEARRLQGLSADRADKSLMERAATLLHAQEALDMKHGSRTRLRRRLKEFEDCSAKIQSVLEDSIRPSKELVPLLAEIESEIQRTRVRLGEDRGQSPLVSKLEEAIHKADSSDALDLLADNIAALHNVGVFTHKEHLRLTKQQLKAYDRLRTREELKPTVQLRRSGWELCQVVASNKKAMVYLDGNNVVHRDDRYAHLFDESGRVNEEVEKALQRDVLAVASKCPAVKFRVVFDSHSASREALTDNVIVHRSGGSGSDRADSAIVLHLTEAPDGDSRFVITDDNSLRQQTTRIGGVYADVTIWSFLVEELGQQRLPMAEEPPATTPG